MSVYMRHVLGLPLDSLVRSKLICCGFSTVEDFKDDMTAEKLKKAVNISEQEARDVVEVIAPYLNSKILTPVPHSCGVSEGQISSKFTTKSVAYILRDNLEQHSKRHIVSFSAEVDQLLGGGFPLGRVIEIAGEAGLGKTQFCFQLCVDVQIRVCLSGVAGEAVYLDVEGTFAPQRVAQMARAAIEHCTQIATVSENVDCDIIKTEFTLDKIMSGIYLFRCRNSVELFAATHQMREFLHEHPKVKLLVVDSVAQCVRGEEDFRTRTNLLVALGRMFRDLIVEFGIAVVLTNQVSTRISDVGASYNIPALGASWSHIANVKVMLHRENGSRFFHQYKSPDNKNGSVEYRVTPEGIRDKEDYSSTIQSQNATQQSLSITNNLESMDSQGNSSIPFYPVTQGIAKELMDDWELHKISQGRETECSEVEIPEKWIQMSQHHLKFAEASQDDEAGSHSDAEDNGNAVEDDQTLENRTLRQCNHSKTKDVIQATLETMLSSDSPVKAPPKRKRTGVENDTTKSHVAKKNNQAFDNNTPINLCLQSNALPVVTDKLVEIESPVMSPSSPILQTKTRKRKR